jgi:translation initiation factor IF-2
MSAKARKTEKAEPVPEEAIAPEEPEETVSELRVELPTSATVKQLAELLDASVVEVIKQLIRNGTMASINQVVDYNMAAIVASDFGYEPVPAPRKAASARKPRSDERLVDTDKRLLEPRPAVVTIMGHVDHGKTSLLDAIRETRVTATEVGEITQHIGAYQVDVNGKKITFLDTPGHEAFTAMRARGARVTDITILVVAADDGVMPQTVEAIDHARAAGVPIVVAINKVDKPDSNPQRVKQQLADLGLVCEEWGGEVVCLSVSAKKKEGIAELLENLLIVAELEELQANPEGRAGGTVIEAKLDKTKGSLGTVLVQSGTLRVGDAFTVGDTWGKVKAMFDEKGKRVRKAGPATPVEVLGCETVPQAGDMLSVVASEAEARSVSQRRQEARKLTAKPRGALSASELSAEIREGRIKELNIILKTDVQGSVEPITTALAGHAVGEVRVNLVHSGSGSITEGDVLLALASKGLVLGFNTAPEPGAKQLADSEGIDIRCYEVIYNLVDDVEKLLTGMLDPTYVEVIEGRAEVRATFSVRGRGVAGAHVTEGTVTRGAPARVIRKGQVIHESTVSSLRRFKDDVREVSAGFECGAGIEGFTEFEVGDIIELYGLVKQ